MAFIIGKSGVETHVESQAASRSYNAKIAPLPDGNFIVVWEELYGSDYEVRARIVDEFGALVGAEFVVNANSGSFGWPSVAVRDNGNIVFTYRDFSGSTGFIREFDGLSYVGGPEILFPFPGEKTKIVELESGDFVISNGDANFGTYSSDFSTYLFYNFSLDGVDVAPLSGTQYVVAYESGGDIFCAVRNVGSSPPLGSIAVNTVTAGTQHNVKVTTLDNGNIVVTWIDESHTARPANEVKARIFSSMGDALTDEIQVNTSGLADFGYSGYSQVTSLSNGGFVVVWTSSDTSNTGIAAQVFDQAGNRIGSEIFVNTTTFIYQELPEVNALAGGGFAVTWIDFGPGLVIPTIRSQAFSISEIEQETQSLIEGNSVIGNMLDDATIPLGVTLTVQTVNTLAENVGTEVQGNYGRLTIQTDGSYSYIADAQKALDLGSEDNAVDVFVIGFVDQFENFITEQLKFYVQGLDNYILGTAGVDTLNGTAGRDIIMGDAGNDIINGNNANFSSKFGDILYGGTGDDTYTLKNASDHVVEFENEGKDTVKIGVSYALTADVENLELTGTNNISGTGNELANKITGNAKNNNLDGGAGADTLIGLAGDDSYTVDNAGDVVTEATGQGTDIVYSSLLNYTLTANVENLTLTSGTNGKGNTLNNVINGNSAANTLQGDAGNDTLRGYFGLDTLIGGAGDDTYYIQDEIDNDIVQEASGGGTDTVISEVNYTLTDNVENLTLLAGKNTALSANGNSLANILVGNEFNNILSGGGGADKMTGGDGDDTYYVDNIGDQTIETNNQSLNDLVYASVDYTLSNGVDKLILMALTQKGTGNSLDNYIQGNAANNTLDGKGGADKMYGLDGNDTYVVDNLGDVVSESGIFLGTGTDLVQSSVTFTLGENIENLTLTGTAHISGFGNALDNIITGNSGNNTLNGGAGKDTLVGGLGNDAYYIDLTNEVITENANAGTDTVFASVSGYTLANNVENLTLTGTVAAGTGNSGNNLIVGNSAANTLTGAGGNDTLDGGAGVDTLIGGLGNDIYYVDDANDIVTELVSQGTDTVYVSGTGYNLADNVENLFAANTGGASLNGNALANTIVGNADNNLINGWQGNDTLTGRAGADTFRFGNGFTAFGRDRITDFQDGQDTIHFGTQFFVDFNDVFDSAVQTFSGTVIAYDANNSVLLMGVNKASLDSGDFVFSF